jgi:hypothetical protein
MTLSDTDLEATLRRELHARADEVPPAPRDLAVLTRQRHRTLRRREIGVAGAVLAVVLVFVGVPVIAGTLADGDRGQTAHPSPTHEPATTLDLAELPTRGSLADDEDWLTGVLQLDWLPPGRADVQGALDPPLETRTVAYAGDVPGARVALVLGDWAGLSWHVWFLGPEGATPDEMEPGYGPSENLYGQPMALIDRADPAAQDSTLVVVAFPGDTAEVLLHRDVDATGQVIDESQIVRMDDGVAATTVRAPADPLLTGALWVTHGSEARQLLPELSPRWRPAELPEFTIADPRDLAGTVDVALVHEAATCIVTSFGIPQDQLGLTLLAAGPLGDEQDSELVLLGATFPSGATTACLAERQTGPEPDSIAGTTTLLQPHSANGAPLLDQVFAAPSLLTGAVAVSGPSAGSTAELSFRSGRALTSVPLVDGAGLAWLRPPSPDTVRILDGSGAVLVEAPLSTGIR